MAFSTPLICCSRGVMTVSAMVFGEAPGYWPLTTTVGGTISGYSLMGSAGMASSPATVIKIASTVAKIGRSMKKEEMFIGLGGTHLNFLRVYRDSRMHSLRAVHHDHLSRLQSFAHDTQTVDDAAKLHLTIFDHVVGTQHENVFLALIGVDGSIVDQDRRVFAAAEQLDPGEQPRRVLAILVLQNRAGAYRTGLRIQLVVDEIDGARVRKAFLVGQSNLNGIGRIARTHALAGPRHLR